VVALVLASRGTDWQILKDYQYRRIDAFLDPSIDPLGASYHINQAMIALGSGGWSGRGFMQGTQSRLQFLPEKHTDFIFTTLAEEFGFVGGCGSCWRSISPSWWPASSLRCKAATALPRS
jgi:rod shape determining protein RodA